MDRERGLPATTGAEPVVVDMRQLAHNLAEATLTAKKEEEMQASRAEEAAEKHKFRQSTVVYIGAFVLVALIVAIVVSQVMDTAAERGLAAATVGVLAANVVVAYAAWHKSHKADAVADLHEYSVLLNKHRLKEVAEKAGKK